MTDNIEHDNLADNPATESGVIVESGVNTDSENIEYVFGTSSSDDNIDDLINELQLDALSEGDELPNVDLTASVDTTSTISDTDVDLSFINEENHYSMHKTIRNLINSKRIETSNSQLLFDALNDYYAKFCQKLNTNTSNSKYYAFKFPTDKPKKLSESSITSYISRYYSDDELNSVRSCINTFLDYDVLKCNSTSRTFSEHLGDTIVLVKVKEYPNLVVSSSELDQLNSYTLLNRDEYNKHHSINTPIINDYSVFKSVKSKDNINDNKIIRYQYVTLNRRMNVLSRINDSNNKSDLVKDLKRIYNFQHDSTNYPKQFNFKIFNHTEDNIRIIRNVFEYLTYSECELIDSSTNEHSLISPTYNRYNSSTSTIYFIAKKEDLYSYGYSYYNSNEHNSTLQLLSKSLDFVVMESKIWITNSSIDDIKLNDVLPLIFLIKANIDLKSTIYDKSSLCYVYNSSSNARSRLLTTVLDNYYKNDNTIKFAIDYSNLYMTHPMRKIYVNIFLKKNYITNMISKGCTIARVFTDILCGKEDFQMINPDVYINVLNTPDSKPGNRDFDSAYNSKLIYSFNKDNIPISSSLDESLESNININLFDYQKSNIMWMKNLENDITSKKLEYNFTILKGLTASNRNYLKLNYEDKEYLLKKSVYGNYYTPYHQDDIYDKLRGKVPIPGGVICDEVGLGKTLSTVSHIVTQIEEDKRMRTYKMLEYDINNVLILPARLVSQWMFELNKYIKDISKFTVVKLGTLTDVKKLDKQLAAGKINLLDIDILLVCSNLLRNPKYTALINENQKKYTSSEDRYKFIDIFTTKFNRIIVDEIHEITIPYQPFGDNSSNFLYSRCHKTLRKEGNELLEIFNTQLRSNFKWCLTATPFNYGPFNLMGILNFLIDVHDKGTYQDTNNNYGIVKGFYDLKQMDNIIKTHFKGIKKSDVRNVIDIPIFSEKIIKIPLSNIEKNIYNSNKTQLHLGDANLAKRLFAICTNICIANLFTQNDVDSKEIQITTLEDLNKMMIKKFKTSRTSSESEKKKIMDNIAKYERDYKQFENIHKILKQIINWNNYNDFKKKYTYRHVRDCLEIYKSSIRSEDYESFGINQYDRMFQFKIMLCRIWHIMYQSLNKVGPISGDSNKEYIESINTISNCIDDILKEDEIASLNVGLLTQNMFTESLNDNILKGFMSKVALSHYQVNKERFATSSDKIKSLDNDIKRFNNQIKLFSSNDFIKEKTSEPCMICFEEFDKVIVTKCRHVYCGDCHQIMSKNNTIAYSCPECRGNVQPSQVIMTTMDKINQIEEEKEKEEDSNVEEVTIDKTNLSTEEILKIKEWRNQCINKYGSKMTYLIEYLQEILVSDENRVIIFSQYDNMLKLIGKTLDEYKIKNVFCKGNVNTVSKRINMFKTDKSIRVIMLSSDKSNSGSNLTEANHIILVDVLNASKETTKDMECQAIGRAVRLGQKKPVTVTRLITTGTIEEEYYNKNKYNIVDIQ